MYTYKKTIKQNKKNSSNKEQSKDAKKNSLKNKVEEQKIIISTPREKNKDTNFYFIPFDKWVQLDMSKPCKFIFNQVIDGKKVNKSLNDIYVYTHMVFKTFRKINKNGIAKFYCIPGISKKDILNYV